MAGLHTLTEPLDEKRGFHRYVAALQLDLCQLILSCVATPTRYLHIYADELTWTLRKGKDGVSEKNGVQYLASLPGSHKELSLRYIHVFARSLLEDYTTADYQANRTEHVDLLWAMAVNNGKKENVRLAVHYQECHPRLRMGFPAGDFHQETMVPMGRSDSAVYAGVLLTPILNTDTAFDHTTLDPDSTKSSTRLDFVPSGELLSETSIEPAGSMDVSPASRKSYLILFLKRLFLETSHDVFGDSKALEKCISRLRFILLCTRTSGIRTTLANSAASLLERLAKPVALAPLGPTKVPTLSFDVPVLDIDKYMALLADYIGVVKDLEAKKDTALKADQDKANQKQRTSLMVEAMSKLCMANGMRPDQEPALAAMNVVASTQASLRGKEKDLEKAKDVFQLGIIAYAKGEEDRVFKETMLSFIEIGASIGAAIYTSGAGAPLTAGTIGTVLKNIDKAVSKWERIKLIFKKLSDSLPPLIKGLKSSFDGYSQHESRIDRLKGTLKLSEDSKTLASHIPELCGPTIDYYTLMAQWEDFKVDIEVLFSSIQQIIGGSAASIDGMADYHGELRKVAIRGLNVLDAQRVVQQKVQEYYRAVADSTARKEAETQILLMKSAIDSSSPDTTLLVKVKQELENVLSSARIQTFAAFYDALLSYVYRAGSSHWPESVVSVVNTETTGTLFETQCIELKRLLSIADANFHNLQTFDHDVVFDTSVDTKEEEKGGGEGVFVPYWKDILRTDRNIPFKIPAGHPMLQDWYHTRVRNVYATFEVDEQHSLLPNLPYYITLGPQFLDQGEVKEEGGSLLRYTIDPPYGLQKTGKTGQWDDQRGLYILPPVCCSGTISFSEVDFEKFGVAAKLTRVRITFECIGMKRKPT